MAGLYSDLNKLADIGIMPPTKPSAPSSRIPTANVGGTNVRDIVLVEVGFSPRLAGTQGRRRSREGTALSAHWRRKAAPEEGPEEPYWEEAGRW